MARSPKKKSDEALVSEKESVPVMPVVESAPELDAQPPLVETVPTGVDRQVAGSPDESIPGKYRKFNRGSHAN